MKTVDDIIQGTTIKCSRYPSLLPALAKGVKVHTIVERMGDWVWVKFENHPYQEPFLVTNRSLADGRIVVVE